LGEKTIILLLFLAASFAVVISAVIIYTLLQGSVDFFTDPLVDPIEFVTGDRWVPSGGNPKFGILPLIAGTTLIAGGALLIGTPLGIGAAIYLSEFASPRIRAVTKPIIELLAGIPSIVYGFFALMFISPIIRDTFDATYFNALSAIIVLAIMVLPIVVSISDDAMRAVSNEMREASLAVGATKWETATKVVMPSASSGIIASILLGLGRALGETMAVTMVAGSVANLTFNPFEEVQTMTAYIAQTATGDIPPGVGLEAAFAVGLVLFIITFIVNMIAGRIVQRIKKGASHKQKRSVIREWLKKPFILLSVALRKALKIRDRKAKEITLRRRYIKGRIGVSTMALCLIIAILFLAYLLYSILDQGLGGLSWEFLTNRLSRFPEKAGIAHVIQGSISLMLLTMVITVPIGVGAAIYLNEIAADTMYTRFLRRIIQNLAGVPSIVFGLVGLAIFIRIFDLGRSLIAGSLTLAIMVLPIIVVATEEALKAVPNSFREAARGLGATRWQTVRHHVLPNAKPGILTGTVLALSRAIGETAPILFIGATFAKTGPSGIMDSFLALPLTIFFWAREPKQEFHDLAATTIIVLLIILLAMNSVAIIIRQRAQARRDW
jgi:phosphate ABC transporter permease protein PstC/phosphate ABC transporter permease subunit PstA